ncbi:MAG: RHS repeat protein, partial [Clostridiaceae bacterium]|nr:RHS repeat protein [Clostridiaceae bacterium]
IYPVYYTAYFSNNTFEFEWDTDYNSETKMVWGTDSSELTQSKQNTNLVQAHSITINNSSPYLSAFTKYYWQAQSKLTSGSVSATKTSGIFELYSQDANEPNQEYTDATYIRLNQSKNGTVYHPYDIDFYEIYLDMPGYVYFDMYAPIGKSYMINLWDPYNGVYINATNKEILLPEGTFYFYVSSFGDNDYDPSRQYTVSVDYEEYVYVTEELHFGGNGTYSATGNYSNTSTDLKTVVAGKEFNISRNYNSRDSFNNHFSRGWSFNFEGRIKPLERKYLLSDGSVNTEIDNNYRMIRMPDSSTMIFKLNSNGTYTSEDSRATLAKESNGNHTLLMPDQTKYTFNTTSSNTTGYLSKITDRNGNSTNIIVNSSGKVQSITDAVGHVYSIGYSSNRIQTISDSYGRTVTYGYDGSGRLTSVCDSTGKYTYYTYYTSGKKNHYLKDIKDHALNIIETMDYYTNAADTQKVKTITDIYGAKYEYTYNDLNSKTIIAEITAGGTNLRTIEELYDAAKFIRTNKDDEGVISSTEYFLPNGVNKYGEVKKSTDRNGNITEYVRDERGNPTKIINPDLSFKEYGYDAANNIIWSLDEDGNFVRFVYDANNINVVREAKYLRKLSVGEAKPPFIETGATANVSDYAVTHYTYYTNLTVKGLIQTKTAPDEGVTTFTYDSSLNLTTVSNPEGTAANPIVTTSEYNNMGLLSALVTDKGHRTEFIYNNNGQLLKQTNKAATGDEILRYVYDIYGSQIQEIQPKQYNAANEGANNGYTDNTIGERHTYYANRLLHSITDAENNVTSFTYDRYGNILTETKPNGAVYVYTYDKLNRVKTVKYKENLSVPDANAVLLETYNYTIVNKQPKVTVAKQITESTVTTQTMTFDYAGRLISEYNGDSTNNKIIYTTYYKNGDINTTTDGCGNITYYKYGSFDNIGKLRYDEVWTPFDGDQYSYVKKVYNKKGNMVQEVTSKNTVALNVVPVSNLVTIDYTYYLDDLKKTVIDNEGRKTTYEYDNDRYLSKEEKYYSETGKNTVEYVNNHLGKPTTVKTYVGEDEVVNADGTAFSGEFVTTILNYDKNGNLWTSISPKGVTTTYDYDNLNRQTLVAESGVDEYGTAMTITASQLYDYAGNVIQTIDAKNNVAKNIYDKRGFLRYTINPNNGVIFSDYDLLGRKTGEVKPKNYAGAVTLANAGLTTLSTDIANLANMSRTEYVYDATNMLRQSEDIYLDPLSNTWKTITQYTTYDGNGNVLIETDGMGYITTNTYYKNNLLKTVLDPESNERNLEYTAKYEYNAIGHKTIEYNTQGARTDYTYTNAGNLKTTYTKVDGVSCLMQDNEYDLLDRLRYQTDGEGIRTEYQYNTFNKVKMLTTDGDESMPSNTVVSKYDAAGNLVIISDSCNVVEFYTYDNQNRRTSTNRRKSDGTESITTHTKYDLNGNVRFEQDGELNIKETTYTILNQPYTVQVLGTAPITTYDYDENGNLYTETDFKGNVKRTEYDPLNRLVRAYDANEVLIQTLYYNSNHAQVKSVDALQKETEYKYDKNNRLLYTTDPLGHKSGQTYDDAGFVKTKYDGRNNTTSYEYDELGRNKFVYQTNGSEITTTNYTYDLNGNILTQTNGNEHTTTYIYNKGKKLSSKYDHGGESVMEKTEIYGYDARGRLISMTDRNGNNFTYTFDVHGQQTHTYVDGVLKIEELFDNNGNKRFMTDDSGTTERKYDALNRVVSKDVPNIGETVYQYDITASMPAGFVAEKATDSMGNVTVKIYDKTLRLKEVKDAENATPSVYEYYNNGALKSLTNANDTSAHYVYYDDGTLDTLTNRDDSSNTVDYYKYTYDAAKNQLTKTETIGGVSKGTTIFTYDGVNRLETITEPSGKLIEYTYDGAGTRESEMITEESDTAIITYHYNEQERLNRTVLEVGGSIKTVSYNYDNNGNVYSEMWEMLSPATGEQAKFALNVLGIDMPQDGTAINEYNAFNQLVKTYEGNKTIVNTYNADGLRVSKSVNGATTLYLYEGADVVLETNASGNQTARNLYGINLLSRTADSTTLVYSYNGHADVTALTDGNGTVVASYYYDAFGVELESSGAANNPFRYAGYEFDSEMGLYYLKSRFYDAKIARFMQEDAYKGKISDPLSLNLYTYVTNNPIIYVDYMGYEGEAIFFVHGVNSNVDAFRDTVANLKTDNRFISAGIISMRTWNGKVQLTFNDDFLQAARSKAKMSAAEYNKFIKMQTGEKMNFLLSRDVNVMFRVEFSNQTGGHLEQIGELKTMINEAVYYGTPVTLVGHSKGGIVSVGYANEMGRKVSKVITVNTPYQPNAYAVAASELVNTTKNIYESNKATYDTLKKTYDSANLFSKAFIIDSMSEAQGNMGISRGAYINAISAVSFGAHNSEYDYGKLQGMRDLAGGKYSNVQKNIQYWWNEGHNNGDLSHIKAYALGSAGVGIYIGKTPLLSGDTVVSLNSQLGEGFSEIQGINIALDSSDTNWIHTNVTSNKIYIGKIKELILTK